jgi:HSP20 family protein
VFRYAKQCDPVPATVGVDSLARSALPVNLYETENGYVLQAALPGINPENADIQVTGREITIAGRFESAAPEKVTWIWQGIPSGEFRETYTLPVEIEGGKVEASYEYGILSVTLPKAEHLRPKNVKVAIKK